MDGCVDTRANGLHDDFSNDLETAGHFPSISRPSLWRNKFIVQADPVCTYPVSTVWRQLPKPSGWHGSVFLTSLDLRQHPAPRRTDRE